MKQFGIPPFLREPAPLFQLTPLFLSNFFMNSLSVQISKTRTSPLILRWGGGGERENYASTGPIFLI